MSEDAFGESPAVTPVHVSATEIPEDIIRRYHALLDVGDAFSHEQSLPQLLLDLASKLKCITRFDLLIFALHDAVENVMRLTLVPPDGNSSALVVSVATPMSGWIWETQQAWLISELSKERNYPDTVKYLSDLGMKSACLLPLSHPTRRLGTLAFVSRAANAFVQEDVEPLQTIAGLVALAVDDLSTRQALKHDNEQLQLLLQISRKFTSGLEFEQLFPLISEALNRFVPFDYASLAVPDAHKDGVNIFVVHPAMENVGTTEFVPSSDSQLVVPCMRAREIMYFSHEDLAHPRTAIGRILLAHGVQHACCVPLITSHGVIGTLNIASVRDSVPWKNQSEILSHVASQVAIALENAQVYHEIAALKNKLAEEKLYLEDEIRTELNFEDIIGESPQLKRVLTDAKTVAPSAANVLILGETGTGKELIARAIHKMSGRKDNSFIKLNCAAIPTGLLESELFGHERGAFTGAITQKIGRMELANGGTLFLDEVGDIPLELQPKLLRVLQDQEFERLGSTRTIKVNVRLIAATNRDLAALVAAREFRSDLYYRLKVFPVQLPPLRDRRADIPLLVRYFVQRLSRRMNKVIDSIPTATMDTLINWDWPGNIRELENFMERSVILSTGPILTIPATELRPLTESTSRRDTSLETADREHILRILRETGGVISGIRGAAARLGLKRTTLQSKMQKLGISRMDYQG